MAEHTREIPRGRSVYFGNCEHSYIVPDGAPDILSVDDLPSVKAIVVPDLDGKFFADENNEVLIWSLDLAEQAQTFHKCLEEGCKTLVWPDDEDVVQFGPHWVCATCEEDILYDTEEDAERCCSWTRGEQQRLAEQLRQRVMPSQQQQPPQLNSIPTSELKAELERRRTL